MIEIIGIFGQVSAMRQVVPNPGFIVGPIARLFSFVIDFLFNIIYAIAPAHSLGFTIIFTTILIRCLTLPLNLKMQRSMLKMRELKPEMDKIKEKYGKTNDPELKKKMNAETSALMAKHGANPLSGCLPMLIQMPIFIGLNFIIRQTFRYITRLGNLYDELSAALIRIPGLVATEEGARGPLSFMADAFIPNNLRNNMQELSDYLYTMGWWYDHTIEQLEFAIEQVGDVVVYGIPEHLSRVINRFNTGDWERVYGYIQNLYPAALSDIQEQVSYLMSIEMFFGLHMVEPGSLAWPTIIIPFMILITGFVSSWLMQQRNFDPNADDKVKLQQKIMLFAMPIFLAAITIGMPVGVGIFWIVGQTFQAVTDIVLIKRDGIPVRLPFGKPKTEVEVVDKIPSKKK